MKDSSLSLNSREVVRDRDWPSILSRFHSSGLSIRAYSAQEGIATSTLRDRLGLRKRVEKRSSGSVFDNFIPVDLSSSVIEVELEFRDGTKLRIKG